MKNKIYKNSYLGTIEIENNTVSVIEDREGTVEQLCAEIRKNGITGRKELIDGDKFTIVEIPVAYESPDFGIFLVEWLERNGYTVEPDTAALDQEIQTLLSAVADEALKQQIVTALPTMNYLEKTYILSLLNK